MPSCQGEVLKGTLAKCPVEGTVYLLPIIFRHGLQLVSRHQLLQHLGNHDKLVLIIVDFYPEEKSCDVDHFLFGTNMIASQVLR